MAPSAQGGRARLGRALDDMVGDDPGHLDQVRARFLAARGRPGLHGLRLLLDQRGDGYVPTESELETELRVVLTAPDLPPVTWQAPLPWHALPADGCGSAGRSRVDALIEPWRVVVEADGRRWHTRVADFERDHARDLAALRHGYVVARFTWSQLTGGREAAVDALVEIGAARTAIARTHAPVAP